MIGTEDEPIELFPGREFEEYVVEISGTGVETLEYCNVINPYFGGGTYDEAVDFVDHCSLTQNTEGVYYRRISGGSISESHVESQRILRITNTQLIGIRPERDSMFYELRTNLAENCLFDSCLIDSIETFSSSLIFENNALLKGEAGEHSPFDASSYYNASPTVEPPELRVASEVYTDEETGRKYLCVYLAAEGEEFEYNYLKAAARALGGDLLSINDDSELAFLTSVIWDGKNYELGIYYNDFTRRYEWADGNTYSIDIKPYNSNNPNTLGHNWPFVGLSFATGSYQADYKIDRSVLEFPADVADEDILSCFEDFDYKSWAAEYANQYRNNAILNPLLNTAPELWTRFISEEFDYDYLPNYITGNYWGTENDRLIDKMIVDGNDYAGTYQELVYEPILTLESGSLEDIYPFVTEILLEDEDGNIVSDVQPGEAYAVHVFFNRDMNREVQPAVTFGGALPYTDYSVHGDFVSEREWVGTAFISPVMNSGTMYFKTTGGCAADDSWLVCGDDVLRFSFEVESVGVLAMLLNAEGGTNKVTLSWAQNDYEVLGGYNLYRSTSEDSGFAKLNTSVLTGTSYEDTDVEPGVMYYYYFKVVNTEGNEEENTSNIASAKPIDNIAPVLTHSVIKKAKMNTRITVSADASDNIAVSGVVLYYRTAGAEKFKSVDMMNTSGTRYVGTIPASAVTADGVEYYLAASDEDGNIRYSGTEQLPNFIEVDSAPAVTGVTPQQLNIAGGQTVTILGVNFSEGMTLTLGGTVISEYTLVNSGQITFTAPAMKSGRYALVLTDADGRTAAAKEQIVYTDESSVAQIPTAMEMLSGVEYMIPFVAAADSAVTAVHFELDLPSAYFRDVRAEKADADANFTLDYNYSGSLLQVSCIGTADMITQNALVNVFVTPMSTEKISLPVNMHDVRFNGSDVHTVISGTAQITPVFTLDAEVRLWADDAPLAGAVVRADGRTGTTGNDGRVSLTVVNKLVDAAVSCTVPVPSGTITAYDASLVLQNSVGKIELNEYQLIAGDVTGDGRTDEYDASVILQMAVRKISAFPCGCSWSFLPASVSMEMEASGNSAEFTAICMGDVDGSFGMDEEIGATE